MDPAIRVWILGFHCGSSYATVNPGILVWMLEFQWGTWDSGISESMILESRGSESILGFKCEVWYCIVCGFQCGYCDLRVDSGFRYGSLNLTGDYVRSLIANAANSVWSIGSCILQFQCGTWGSSVDYLTVL